MNFFNGANQTYAVHFGEEDIYFDETRTKMSTNNLHKKLVMSTSNLHKKLAVLEQITSLFSNK